MEHLVDSFRLLTEYHSFLLIYLLVALMQGKAMFPSPYGVSFILIVSYDKEA